MKEKDITKINVSNFSVSVIGLKHVMEEMAEAYASEPDEEIGAVMLARLQEDNYIPTSAKKDYERAFVREFRKQLGQPHRDDAARGLDIKILGAGCAQCDRLTGLVMDVLTELNLPAGVEHITDMKEIASFGVMGVPALLINRKVMATGSIPPRERIKKWLIECGASLAPKL